MKKDSKIAADGTAKTKVKMHLSFFGKIMYTFLTGRNEINGRNSFMRRI